MSVRTKLNKGKAAAKKAFRRVQVGNYWAQITVVSSGEKVYKNLKKMKETRLDPMVAAILKEARKAPNK